MEKIKFKLDRVVSQTNTICSLYSNVLACRSPTTNYAFFLLEWYLLSKIKAVRAGKPIELGTIEDFINCYKQHGVKVQRLLCEFYLHNFTLDNEVEKKPNPFVGDVQFQAFISFTVNQLKWSKAYNAFQRQEHGLEFWVRSEPKHPLQMFANHKSLMKREGVIKTLGPIHKKIVQKGISYFLSIQERSLTASKLKWTISTNSVKDREPFNYKNFKAAATRMVTYSNLILREGLYWLGCRFQSPIIWYPPEGHRADYELPEGKEGPAFVLLAQHHGFRPILDAFSLAYSLTTLHKNYLIFMRT